ncbi:MAG TPA: periplasmic heavy metal sensor [Stellaceae bacterium]|nr:periplasmic heavy metal sensor [Stellaceae bacterium]
MSTLAETAGRSVRRPRGLWIALALSLTLNVFVIGGLVWGMLEVQPIEPPAQRFVAVGRSLDLNDTQRAALRQFGVTAREAVRTLHEGNGPVMQQLWVEMAKPQPDEALISHLIDVSTQNRRDYIKRMSSGLMQFMATLSPEERSRFAALAHRPHPVPQTGWHFVLP